MLLVLCVVLFFCGSPEDVLLCWLILFEEFCCGELRAALFKNIHIGRRPYRANCREWCWTRCQSRASRWATFCVERSKDQPFQLDLLAGRCACVDIFVGRRRDIRPNNNWLRISLERWSSPNRIRQSRPSTGNDSNAFRTMFRHSWGRLSALSAASVRPSSPLPRTVPDGNNDPLKRPRSSLFRF